MWIAVGCPRHGCKVLLDGAAVRRLLPRPGGIAVEYACTCGHIGVWEPSRS